MANTTTNVVNLSGIEAELSTLSNRMDVMNRDIEQVGTQVDDVRSELKRLRADFVQMMDEQRRTSALEQATTELVSVRQEMDNKFGGYNEVRKAMVGILQATDAALVRKATVSTVSEELMISTPDYWLAPVLVALAAWINNNRDLAERAIREAIRRDNEHTSLVMALICRRNHRTATCYEWLARYFSTQDAARIDADAMVYVDAYINGIFGPDEKYLCDDYMAKWISEVSASPDFADKQTDSWAHYFENYKGDTAGRYPALQAVVKEFSYIDKYLGKADAVEAISGRIDHIKKADVDSESLAKQVDRHLMALVQADDPKERELRAQEEYLLAVKACGGDIDKARRIVNDRMAEKRRQTMDIVQQMTRVVRDQSGKVEPYKKKTAMQFLGTYIDGGLERYRTHDVPAFPERVTLSLDGWSGTAETGDATEGARLKGSYHQHMDAQKQSDLQDLATANDSHVDKYAAIALAVVGVVLCFTGLLPLGVVAFIAALVCFNKANGKKKYEDGAKQIEDDYAKSVAQGENELDLVLGQWRAAKKEAADRAYLLRSKDAA